MFFVEFDNVCLLSIALPYLDMDGLFQQHNVTFRRLLNVLNIDREHFSRSHAIARLTFSRRVNGSTPLNFILPGLNQYLMILRNFQYWPKSLVSYQKKLLKDQGKLHIHAKAARFSNAVMLRMDFLEEMALLR